MSSLIYNSELNSFAKSLYVNEFAVAKINTLSDIWCHVLCPTVSALAKMRTSLWSRLTTWFSQHDRAHTNTRDRPTDAWTEMPPPLSATLPHGERSLLTLTARIRHVAVSNESHRGNLYPKMFVWGGKRWQEIYPLEFIALFVAVETRERDLGAF